jgi:hypothetical protein
MSVAGVHRHVVIASKLMNAIKLDVYVEFGDAHVKARPSSELSTFQKALPQGIRGNWPVNFAAGPDGRSLATKDCSPFLSDDIADEKANQWLPFCTGEPIIIFLNPIKLESSGEVATREIIFEITGGLCFSNVSL